MRLLPFKKYLGNFGDLKPLTKEDLPIKEGEILVILPDQPPGGGGRIHAHRRETVIVRYTQGPEGECYIYISFATESPIYGYFPRRFARPVSPGWIQSWLAPARKKC